MQLYRGLIVDTQGAKRLVEAAAAEIQSPRTIERYEYPALYVRLPDTRIDRSGLASFTTDKNVAEKFAHHSEDRSVIIRAEVPRTSVVSVPAYGINVYGEREIVVAGNAWKGWDAWDVGGEHSVPDFKAVPIEHDSMKKAA